MIYNENVIMIIIKLKEKNMTNKSLTEIEMKSIMGGYSFNPSVSSIDRFDYSSGYSLPTIGTGRAIYGWIKWLFRRW